MGLGRPCLAPSLLAPTLSHMVVNAEKLSQVKHGLDVKDRANQANLEGPESQHLGGHQRFRIVCYLFSARGKCKQ